jgi:hypothetical protein
MKKREGCLTFQKSGFLMLLHLIIFSLLSSSSHPSPMLLKILIVSAYRAGGKGED